MSPSSLSFELQNQKTTTSERDELLTSALGWRRARGGRGWDAPFSQGKRAYERLSAADGKNRDRERTTRRPRGARERERTHVRTSALNENAATATNDCEKRDADDGDTHEIRPPSTSRVHFAHFGSVSEKAATAPISRLEELQSSERDQRK